MTKYLDMDELAVRIAMICSGQDPEKERPSGKTGHELMESIAQYNPKIARAYRQAAIAAARYVAECTENVEVREVLVEDGGRQ